MRRAILVAVVMAVVPLGTSALPAEKRSSALELLSGDADDMTGLTWYSCPDESSSLRLYFATKRGATHPLRLAATHVGDQWVFATSLLVRVDGKVFRISPPRSAWNRQVEEGWVSESVDIPAALNPALLRALGVAQEIKVRFDGQRVADEVLLDSHVAAIRKVYWVWRAARSHTDPEARAGVQRLRAEAKAEQDAADRNAEAQAKEQAEYEAALARADQESAEQESALSRSTDPPPDPADEAKQERLHECMALIPYDASEQVEFEASTRCYEELSR